MSILLETRQVSKFFGGLTAVDKVDLSVPSQSIAAIIGPNGAGKTTLFNCTSGFYVPEKGEVIFDGYPIQGLPTDRVASLGISRTYQNIRLFSSMTAIENIIVGEHTRLRSSWMDAIIHTPRFNRDEKTSIDEGQRLLKFCGSARIRESSRA